LSAYLEFEEDLAPDRGNWRGSCSAQCKHLWHWHYAAIKDGRFHLFKLFYFLSDLIGGETLFFKPTFSVTYISILNFFFWNFDNLDSFKWTKIPVVLKGPKSLMVKLHYWNSYQSNRTIICGRILTRCEKNNLFKVSWVCLSPIRHSALSIGSQVVAEKPNFLFIFTKKWVEFLYLLEDTLFSLLVQMWEKKSS